MSRKISWNICRGEVAGRAWPVLDDELLAEPL
jgi:hypothetical protein